MKATPVILSLAIVWLLSHTAISQCYPDRHSMTPDASWISCNATANPNSSRPNGHWIQYDLGERYNLGALHIWNLNLFNKSQMGFNEMAIDYSTDGVAWQSWGSTTVPRAIESSIYQGHAGPDLTGISARYLLLTALSNHGDACYGLGEVRIATKGIVSSTTEELAMEANLEIFPNPFIDELNIALVDLETSVKYQYKVIDALGALVEQGTFKSGQTYQISTANWSSGAYFVQIINGNHVISKPVTRISND